MYNAVGIDASKKKSTVAVLQPGEKKPIDFWAHILYYKDERSDIRRKGKLLIIDCTP